MGCWWGILFESEFIDEFLYGAGLDAVRAGDLTKASEGGLGENKGLGCVAEGGEGGVEGGGDLAFDNGDLQVPGKDDFFG